jgi:hypothetical protein
MNLRWQLDADNQVSLQYREHIFDDWEDIPVVDQYGNDIEINPNLN